MFVIIAEWIYPVSALVYFLFLYKVRTLQELKSMFDVLVKLYIKYAIVLLILNFACAYIVDDLGCLMLPNMIWPALVFATSFVLAKIKLPKINVRQYKKGTNPGFVNLFFSNGFALWLGYYTLIFVLCYLPAAIYHINHWNEYISDAEIIAIELLILFVMFAVSIYLIVKSVVFKRRAICHDSLHDIDLRRIKNPPILFLRSFGVTTSAAGLSSGVDEFLFGDVDMMRYPVISLANPDYSLEGGSLKFQATDDAWHDVITCLYPNCSLVIMLEGKSEGLEWEIQRIKKYVTYDKLMIVTLPEKLRFKCWYEPSKLWIKTPSSKKEAKKNYQFVWENFARRFREQGIMLSETDYGSGKIITFNDKWEVDKVANYDSSEDFEMFVKSAYDKRNVTGFDYTQLLDILKPYEVTETVPDAIVQQYDKYTALLKVIFKILFPISILLTLCYYLNQ